MVPHVPGAFLCACRWVVGHASLWRTLSARWRRACVWSGVGADTRRHASFTFRGGACCFALWGGDACTFALRGGGGACIFALRSGGACCFALWGGGACSFTFRGSAGCFCFRCVSSMGCATCARREEKPLTPRVRTWQVRRHRPSVLHPHSVAPQHLVLLPHLAARLRLGLHRQHRRLAHPPNSAEHQLSVRARFSAHYSSPRAHDSACPFVHRWQRCFRRRPRRWCFCRPFRWWRWVCELRSSSGKRWIWGFGAGRRFCTCAVVWGASLRPVNGQWSSAGVSAAACCGRADVRLSGIGTLVHGGRLHPVNQQYKRIYRRARGSTGAIATLHGLLSGLVSMHSTQPRLYLR